MCSTLLNVFWDIAFIPNLFLFCPHRLRKAKKDITFSQRIPAQNPDLQ